LSFSYSNTATEWSQPRLINQVEEDVESRGGTDDTEEKPELHKHGEVHFQDNRKCLLG
jgi:chromosome transmission fidelity protein 4